MPFQTSFFASDAYQQLRSGMPAWKAQAQNALAFMQANSVDADYVFKLVDNLRAAIVSIQAMIAVAGIDAYATSLGYTGSMVTDGNATISAAQNVIAWIGTNIPKDAGNFLQVYTLNADGSRTARSFTPAQTAGLQSSLSSLIATIQ